MLGLLLSALARSNEQIMPLLVVSLMMQLVLSGGMVPVTNRIFLDQLSWVVPVALGVRGAGVDGRLVDAVARSASPEGQPLQHTSGTWLFDMGMLAVLSVVYTGIVRWRIRLKR